MKPNPYTGDVPVEIEGWPRLTLRFDWQAIAQMQAQFGDRATRLVLHNDVGALLDLTVIALRRHHPNLTRADLELLPPALVPLAEAVTGALALAYHGPGGDKEGGDKEGENPPNRAARRTALARSKSPIRSKRR
jgi:hypothetical protein